MKVIMIATGGIVEVNESYGARLMEQGKAVIAPVKKEALKPQSKSGTKIEEKPEKKRAKE